VHEVGGGGAVFQKKKTKKQIKQKKIK